MSNFHFFWNGPFSSWHIAPISINGITYNCCEQYFMWKKALAFGDEDTAEKIITSYDPRKQKSLGRQVKNFVPAQWDAISRDVMFRAHMAKYERYTHLRDRLLATGATTLVEASPYDKLWGIGLDQNDPRALNSEEWLGKNWLGYILTDIKRIFQCK